LYGVTTAAAATLYLLFILHDVCETRNLYSNAAESSLSDGQNSLAASFVFIHEID
jgi:hypothetical protein